MEDVFIVKWKLMPWRKCLFTIPMYLAQRLTSLKLHSPRYLELYSFIILENECFLYSHLLIIVCFPPWATALIQKVLTWDYLRRYNLYSSFSNIQIFQIDIEFFDPFGIVSGANEARRSRFIFSHEISSSHTFC